MRDLVRAMMSVVRACAVVALPFASIAGAATWQQLEAPGFTLLSDASKREIEGFALNYAAYREALKVLFVPEGQRLPPSTLVLFRSQSQFEKHARKSQRDGYEMKASSMEMDGRPLVALAVDGDRARAQELAFEFETIWALRRLGYLVPIWMSQGSGRLLSSLELKKGECVFGDGRSSRDLYRRSSGWIDWPRFFDIHTGSPEYAGSRADGMYHEQAWGLMHWILLRDEGGVDRFRRLAQRWRETSALLAVEEVMGESSKNFSREVRRYVLREAEPRRLAFDEAATRASWTLSAADPARVHTTLAYLLDAAGRPKEAEAAMALARAAGTDNVAYLEGMARRLKKARQDAEALALYRQAILAGSRNPVAYLVSADGYLDESQSAGADYAGGGGNNVHDAEREIQKALELDPGSPEAYRLLGRMYFISPKVPEDAIERLSVGVTSGEAGAAVRLYRAWLYQRAQKMDEALADFRAIMEDPEVEPRTKARARDTMSRMAINVAKSRLDKSLRTRQYDEALTHLDQIEKAAADDELTADFAALRSFVAERRTLDELQDLRKARDWRAFILKAEAFLSTYPQSRAASQVTRLLEEARKQSAAQSSPVL